MNRYRIQLPLFRDPRVTVLLFVLAVCSGYYTYRGAAMVILTGLAAWIDHAGAMIFAIASSTAIFLLWTGAPRAFEKLETISELVVGMCITILASAMIFSLSSWLNVAGIAGQSALVFHMNARIVAYEDVLDERYATAISINDFRSNLKQANTLYLARRDSELQHGAYTGVHGPGTVERLLGAVAGRFLEQDKAIAEELADVEGVAQKARRVLVSMRAVANQPGATDMRMDRLAREADQLRALLGRLGPEGLVDGVRRTLAGMPREVALLSVSGKTKEARQAQKAALQRIQEELTETVDLLSADLQRLVEKPPTDVPTVTRLNAVEAVLRYPLQNAPYWAGGIAMDFTPTLLLLFAVLMKIARGQRGLFVDDVNNLTVRDLKTAQHGLESLREGRISQGSIDRLHDELTGELLLEDKTHDEHF